MGKAIQATVPPWLWILDEDAVEEPGPGRIGSPPIDRR